jgi:ATP-dependent Clp protease ATP-binding subunit ClpA
VDFSVEVAAAISRAVTDARDRGVDQVESVDVLVALLASDHARASKVVAAVSPELRGAVQLAAMTRSGHRAQYALDQPVPLAVDLQSVLHELRCRQGAGPVQSTDLLRALAQQPAVAQLLERSGVQLAELNAACGREEGHHPEPATQAASAQSQGSAVRPVDARPVPGR